jgi:hypothetical protein
MTQPGSSAHSPDSRWWWNGERWLPAYSADGRWWFNGTAWVLLVPAWRRWTLPTGLLVLFVGVVGSIIVFPNVAGDPGPGYPLKPVPGWVSSLAFTASALCLVGIGLLLAAPIQQARAARSRRRLQAAGSGQSH